MEQQPSKRSMIKRFWKQGLLLASVLLLLVWLYLWYLSQNRQNQQVLNMNGYTTEQVQQASAQANAFFERYFDEITRLDPEWKTYLGINDQQLGEWTPLTEAHEQTRLGFLQKSLQFLKDSINKNALDNNARLSHRILEYRLQRDIEAFEYRHNNYLCTHMRGVHTGIPSMLKDMQPMRTEQDIQFFLKRLGAVQQHIDQLIEQMQVREQKGVILPKILFPKVIETTANLLKGFPLDESTEKHPIYEAFNSKLDSIVMLSDTQKSAYRDLCIAQMRGAFRPAYQKLLLYLQESQNRAPEQIGVWHWASGEQFYAWRLRYITTTNISPDQIHQIGLEEISRIHEEMKVIMQKTAFQGSLQDFFKYMRESDTFYYANTAEGKAAFLADTRKIIDDMRPKLPELFATMPKAALEVRAVEPYEEKSAGKAFYRRGTADGSRPGTYFVNTYDMRQVPNYQMEALAYHEAIPGHHMQLSIAQEMTDIPQFRRHGDYTAYIEGWGLYAELLGKELGFYQNPYSDFGRLAMELWRACRLVVDTGIHSKRWSRDKALQFYIDNTPNSEIDCVKMVDRHIAMPGQAVAYKIGMITLLELRAKAQNKLGSKFNLRQFHEVVLRCGAVPLTVLEDIVDEYIAQTLR